jgi:hypothetical protein
MPAKVTWPRSNQKVALKEGWDIFQTDALKGDAREQRIVNGQRYGYRPFELCKVDQTEVDETGQRWAWERWRQDRTAWRFVVRRARAGSKLHRRALAFLRQRSPNEYRAIMAYMKGR